MTTSEDRAAEGSENDTAALGGLPDEHLRLGDEYFETMYSQDDDPWRFASSWYERRKYDLTLAALPRQRYGRIFEPGCSLGVLSEGLAARGDELISMELIPRIAEKARVRLLPHANATVVHGAIPEVWPEGLFDLVVLSEIAYYLSGAGLRRTLGLLTASTRPGADIVAVHYLGTTNYPQTGQAVQETFRQWTGSRLIAHYEEAAFSVMVMRL